MKFPIDGDEMYVSQSVTRAAVSQAVDPVQLWSRQLKSGWEKEFSGVRMFTG
ncbi:hypothetical protein GCM10009001_13100 [Virgibacillus siamensis]|uniref:Uncharacterized protein n=1 Tax=Virgibacillus siamensis TaxID=480071 RepID=A0ABP3R177_9BACI